MEVVHVPDTTLLDVSKWEAPLAGTRGMSNSCGNAYSRHYSCCAKPLCCDHRSVGRLMYGFDGVPGKSVCEVWTWDENGTDNCAFQDASSDVAEGIVSSSPAVAGPILEELDPLKVPAM